MPASYEPINIATDVTTTKALLHEIIPLTGSVVSGTYNDENVKNYTHGMFQSVYDYPYLSSSANHIFDITLGYDESSILSASTADQNSKKINMYNQFTQVLLGYTGSDNTVRLFESDLKLDKVGAMKETFIVSFSRLLTKDQIKKGTFNLQLGLGGYGSTAFDSLLKLQDLSATTSGDGTLNVIGGDYGVLYDATASIDADGIAQADASSSHGVIFYQAGIAVVSASAFEHMGTTIFNSGSHLSGSGKSPLSFEQSMVSASISGTCDALRHRIYNLSFNNSTEVNSTIYFCRMPTNKFNYSSNPTYLTGSKIRVKDVASELPLSYVTTIGLYNARNELLATAKLSEPLKKTPSNELTIRVRLDY